MRLFLIQILILMSLSLTAEASKHKLEVVAEGLDQPWSFAVLPNGDFLVSFLNGELRVITQDGTLGKAIRNTPPTYVAGQGGYFDVVLDPLFELNEQIYLAFAHGSEGQNATRVISARLDGDALVGVKPIFTVKDWKDTSAHYGGKLQFISDGTLLLTTGDGFDYREAAQDKFSQLGKIIRMNKDGSVPSDNPFADGKQADPYVYSLGHRNPQGLSFDPKTRIVYMHEHGPKGGDEINIVSSGANFGWPITSNGINYSGAKITPFTERDSITSPNHVWTPSIAPSGLAYYDGEAFPDWKDSLFIGALVNKEVRRIQLSAGKVVDEEALFQEVGQRVRDIRIGNNGLIYFLTEDKDSKNGQLIRVIPLQ